METQHNNKHKIIYIKDELKIQYNNSYYKLNPFQDDLYFNSEFDNYYNFQLFYETLVFTVQSDFSTVSLTNILQEDLYMNSLYSIISLTPLLQENLYLNESWSNEESIIIKNKDSIVLNENWCNSDNVQNDNVIKYTVNADILVNDVLYSTLNIQNYQFV